MITVQHALTQLSLMFSPYLWSLWRQRQQWYIATSLLTAASCYHSHCYLIRAVLWLSKIVWWLQLSPAFISFHKFQHHPTVWQLEKHIFNFGFYWLYFTIGCVGLRKVWYRRCLWWDKYFSMQPRKRRSWDRVV